MIPIFIPTRGRIERQITWGCLPEEVRKHTRLVCTAEETNLHLERGRNVQLCPVEGISNKLQWIQEFALEWGIPKIVCVHDDIWFKKRISKEDYHLRTATPKQIIQLFETVKEALDEYVSVGIRNRAHSNKDSSTAGLKWFAEVGARQVIFHATKPKELQKLGIRYDVVNLMEDFHVTLSLLEAGYPNLILHDYCYHETPPGTPGGCALYRDAEYQNKAAKELHRLHPHFVKLVKKPARWGMEESLDVIIAWKKAFESGKMKSVKKLF